MTDSQPAGATPVVPGAMPGQTPAQPAAAAPATPSQSATDYPDGMGDAGKRALDAMKAERDAALKAQKNADKALADLQAATASDADKALAQARKDGAAEVLVKAQDQIRRSEVKAALAAAGLQAGLIPLAARADEFASLKVNDDGDVEGLGAAVDAFKKAQPDLFKPAAGAGRPAGDAGLGPRGRPSAGGTDLNSWIREQAGHRT